MIDGSEKRKRQLVFELQSSRVYEKRSNALKSFESVNSILVAKPVAYQEKNLLMIYAVSFSAISRACFNVFVSRARDLKLEQHHPYGN